MIVYKDIISGDEMLSSAFPLKQAQDAEGNDIPGLMYCESKIITKGADNVDVGCGDAFGGGDAEADGGDAAAEKVNNVIDGFQYTETGLNSAADLKSWIKDYMNKVVLKLREKGTPKEEIQKFKAGASAIAVFLIKNFREIQFYLGPSFDPDSMVFAMYPEGASAPNFYYIMGGFEEQKF